MPDLAYTDLTELGFADGHTFEGLQANHGQDFLFPLPGGLELKGGRLLIVYRSSPKLHNQSMLRVDINGIPQGARRLTYKGELGVLEIPLAANDLSGHKDLRVSIRASLVINQDRCFDERFKTNFLHILPTTSLALDLGPKPNNLLAAWEFLPKVVTVSLPATLTEQQFATALALTQHLVAAGKEPRFTTLPKLGDIALAHTAQLQQALNGYYSANPDLFLPGRSHPTLATDANIATVPLAHRTLIAISTTGMTDPAQFIGSIWQPLTDHDQYQINRFDGESLLRQKGEFGVSLAQLGLDMAPKYMSSTARWDLLISPRNLPANKRLDLLRLNVTTAPNNGDTPVIFYIFLNNVLQEVVSLENDGQPNRFTVTLAESDQKTTYNRLRFIAQRSNFSGNCSGDTMTYPVQIGTDSAVVIGDRTLNPSEFHDLPAIFVDGFDLLLPTSALEQPTATLTFAAKLLTKNNYPLDPRRIHFYQDGETVKPSKPFLLIGRASLETEKAGIHFDRGQIQVLDHAGQVLLDINQLPGISIAQMVTSQGHHGLWIMPAADSSLPTSQALRLGNDAVAFANETGVLLTLAPDQPKVAQIHYPDYVSWLQHLGHYRFWFLALAWIVVTVTLAHFYLKVRQHRKTSDDT
ncbi:cellulose biosynthesis cyclic di-GMP-binding regulatory protein BcsB [Beggiatoa alba]|nr:cellulose biosynthesis cyclic di-GMP-binding regulatory protein BcsB [Beggiatoa alba]